MFKDKAFKYVASQDAQNMGGGAQKHPPQAGKIQTDPPQYMNAGEAQRESQKPRVIVRQNQGDKRVAAAKSKKRKAVTPEDESTLSMESIEWSHQQHDVTSLANLPSYRLPLLVKVVKGYHGDAGQALAIGQVCLHVCLSFQSHPLPLIVFSTQNK